MILWIFALHGAAMVAAALLGRSSIRRGMAAAGVAPLVGAIWAISQLQGDNAPSTEEIVWVEQLELVLRFSTTPLALMMAALVSGIGVLVFVYGVGYFDDTAEGGARFSTTLLGFSASMLGLVLADSVWTLFIFWEFTSVTSFLLVGHKNTYPATQAAARRALMITGAGGLALLAGLLILADNVGSTSLSDLSPASGTRGTVAAVLIMVAAATKSAQFPFHVWLPGAMAAPTPVSAYLHSATMVKAGVFLVALAGPAFGDTVSWKVLGMAFGIASMMWGGFIALRHEDAKLILAWGTISQLGLIITVLSIGTGKAVFAGVSIILAHALFKAALFCVVGEIDVRTGTRNVSELGGLSRSMPIAFAVAVAASLSMAGAPPLLGFPAKEAAIEAVLGLEGLEQLIAGIGIFGGSVLTVAYTTRFLYLVFGPGPETTVAPVRWAMTIPSAILAMAGFAGYVFIGWVNDIVIPAATQVNPASDKYELIAWPGLKTAFVISMAIIAAGLALGWVIANRTQEAPDARGANVADRTLDNVLILADEVAGRVQHGSLPVYLVTMILTVTLAGTIFLGDLDTNGWVAWDSPFQAILSATIAIAAIGGVAVGSRLGAALTLGAVGVAMAGLFLTHGAPDLALTQLLVETIVVVGFVLGLGHLHRRFPPVEPTWRMIRLFVAIAGGLVVSGGLLAASARPVGQAPVEALQEGSVDPGGGNNVVNVILTDMRALDTLGEVVVLGAVTLGILALASTRSTASNR